eukprot:1178659-Prorocentrum_minimum.AAC.4
MVGPSESTRSPSGSWFKREYRLAKLSFSCSSSSSVSSSSPSTTRSSDSSAGSSSSAGSVTGTLPALANTGNTATCERARTEDRGPRTEE